MWQRFKNLFKKKPVKVCCRSCCWALQQDEYANICGHNAPIEQGLLSSYVTSCFYWKENEDD